MRVFIAGIDGYLGWALAQYLAHYGHEIGGCDNYLRRKYVHEIGSHSATPIVSMEDRISWFSKRYGSFFFAEGDLMDYNFIKMAIEHFKPDVIVHFGECPSAPYSMIDAEHAGHVQANNIVGNLNVIYAMKESCPNAHLIKLGTMGEYGYGTSPFDIPEGFFEVEHKGIRATIPFPKDAGSWYHWSKVHDSNNIMFACKLWGLKSTDIMQGVVFGNSVDGVLTGDVESLTRFDFDEAFGTAINRFCAQAIIGEPITVYGRGKQKRGFLPLKDSLQCIRLIIDNPPNNGEYRVFNQWEDIYELNELGQKVVNAAKKLGINAEVKNIPNPRVEVDEDKPYIVEREHLIRLGYEPSKDIDSEILSTMKILLPFSERIEDKKSLLMPKILWKDNEK